MTLNLEKCLCCGRWHVLGVSGRGQAWAVFHLCYALLCGLREAPASLGSSSSLSTKGGDWLRYEDRPCCLWSTCLAHVSCAHRLTRLMATFLPWEWFLNTRKKLVGPSSPT